MSVVIVATPGAADANSYATLAEAETYVSGRVTSTEWSAATDDEKNAALVMATNFLDSAFQWTGVPVGETQALCWPRSGMLSRNGFAIATTIIPQALKNAQIEFAVQLLATNTTLDNEAAKLGITSVKAGSVAVSFADQVTKSGSIDLRNADVTMAGPEFDWMSRTIPEAVRMLLVDSWYTRRSVSQPLMLRAVR